MKQHENPNIGRKIALTAVIAGLAGFLLAGFIEKPNHAAEGPQPLVPIENLVKDRMLMMQLYSDCQLNSVKDEGVHAVGANADGKARGVDVMVTRHIRLAPMLLLSEAAYLKGDGGFMPSAGSYTDKQTRSYVNFFSTIDYYDVKNGKPQIVDGVPQSGGVGVEADEEPVEGYFIVGLQKHKPGDKIAAYAQSEVRQWDNVPGQSEPNGTVSEELVPCGEAQLGKDGVWGYVAQPDKLPTIVTTNNWKSFKSYPEY